jgi:RNA polymerase sigma factor (sigma-70 family)|tara:strand:+ start:109 stop:606 length:498 start_codon:yes stop_codon:yes gene_type:complete
LTTLEKLASKHHIWVRTVKSFGCKGYLCEDVVQEAYLKINNLINSKGLDISYEDDINYFYMYRTLKSLFLDLCRKESKIQKVNVEYLEKFVQEEDKKEYKDIEGKMRKLNTLLDKMYWYDAKVFNLISDGMSIAELSKQTNISYYSLYNTYKNVKNIIKDNIEWD